MLAMELEIIFWQLKGLELQNIIEKHSNQYTIY